jgi:NUMOD3 motif
MPFCRPHTPETKAKMSASLKGHPVSPETRAKISAAMKGKKLAQEHRLNIRIGHRRTKLFDPERFGEICAARSAIVQAAWNRGAYDNRKTRRSQ